MSTEMPPDLEARCRVAAADAIGQALWKDCSNDSLADAALAAVHPLIRAHVVAELAEAAVERGPEPCVSLPWEYHQADGTIHYALCVSAQVRNDDDGRAIVHRVNNWPALLATIAAQRIELDRLRAERAHDAEGAVLCLTFEEAWAAKEAEGYQYGSDALEQVRFGWEIRDGYSDTERLSPEAMAAIEAWQALTKLDRDRSLGQYANYGKGPLIALLAALEPATKEDGNDPR